MVNRIQVTTDGLRSYLDGVYNAFGSNIDHAVLQKKYANDGGGRYSPPVVVGIEKEVHCGAPNPEHISTSYVERQNLTMRMPMRRFTRLTSGFSKTLANFEANVALHFMHFNFCRVHQTLRVTPAMQAGLADHVWSIEELVVLLD